MRSRSVVPALLTFAAGVAASAVARRFTARRRATRAFAAPIVGAPVAAPLPAPVAPVSEAVVLPFTRAVAPAPAPAKPAAPARCGDNGGRTKAGAPCAARGTAGGRCHHHRLAA
jgi:hypothetical protein